MARKIADSVVVITGASSGIGRATALMLAGQGASLVLAARREEALVEVAEQCEKLGGRALAVPTDVTDEEAVRAIARQAASHFGRIDVWINDAAVIAFGRFEEMPAEAFRQVLETNLFGYVHGARAVIPYFREQGSGTLINVASMVGKTGAPYLSAYTASKYAIVGLSESLRMELEDAPEIHVCTVLPATIDTPFFQHAANYSGRAIQAMPPVYEVDDVARTILSLIQHPRREVTVGAAASRAIRMKKMAPATSEKMLAKRVDATHFQDRPAASSAGNLYEPMAGYDCASGGWKVDEGRRKLPMAGAALGAMALSAGIGYLLSQRYRKPLPMHRRLGRHLSRISKDGLPSLKRDKGLLPSKYKDRLSAFTRNLLHMPARKQGLLPGLKHGRLSFLK
ncbi:SDR family oxidoreductase [Thermithiobacillus plumbiphilus]|uniref:SDR family oxidoreductase n=1 Tax=Thermithiobacillus plumbiphilus TaxID=1729899 RepID=A0ABU9D7R4_9PROT